MNYINLRIGRPFLNGVMTENSMFVLAKSSILRSFQMNIVNMESLQDHL